MIKVRPIIFALGLMLCVVAVAMLLPAVVDYVDGIDRWKAFLFSSLFTLFVGGLLILVTYDDRPERLTLKDGFLLTTISWITVTAFAALPFVGMGLSYTDAYFETMSGLTTTGSTVIVGLDKLPRGILLWRALLSGMGGLGIIVMAIILLPFLRVGGMQLYQTESSDKSEKILPRAAELTMATAGVYVLLIITCGMLYAAFGMPAFDAICHALTTVATGGFSTHDDSFQFFKSAPIEWVAIGFMIAGALPFVIFIRMIRGDAGSLWRDSQVRTFFVFLLVLSAAIAVGRWLVHYPPDIVPQGLVDWVAKGLVRGRPVEGEGPGFFDFFRAALFNVTSIVTTTGFMSEDYQLWGPFAVGLFFMLTFVGGCSGSTAGAIKIYRIQLAVIITRSHLAHLISPRRIVNLTYNGRRLPDDVPISVIAFLAIYLFTVGIFTLMLTAMGLDLVTASSSAAQAVGNVGPGLGSVVGPAGNFSTLPAEAKWVLAFAMMLGRLELFTVLVLLMPSFWRS